MLTTVATDHRIVCIVGWTSSETTEVIADGEAEAAAG